MAVVAGHSEDREAILEVVDNLETNPAHLGSSFAGSVTSQGVRRLTIRDMESLIDSLMLNGMITEECSHCRCGRCWSNF